MSRSIYVIRHINFENLGILESELKNKGYQI